MVNHLGSTDAESPSDLDNASAPSESEIIGYTYDDEPHCITCTAEYFDDNLECPVDDDGQPITIVPIHASATHPPTGLVCADCNEQIVDPVWCKADLYTIVVENTDDDPTQLMVHVSGEYAAQWAEYHGSLAGGTWEKADGPDFVYDIICWAPNLIEQVTAEGFDLDLSQYSDPDPRDLAIAEHATTCEECSYDWHRAEKHMQKINPDL